MLLGVNVDHVATIRQARRTTYPDPVEAARIAEEAGADGITVHLREDRRHIQDHDVERLRSRVRKLNLEMAATAAMVGKALAVRPHDVCLVPERREELTTEGGLDVAAQRAILREGVKRLQGAGIRVSLFIDPDARQVEASADVGADFVELHTGTYSDAEGADAGRELGRIAAASTLARTAGLRVNGGHGLRLDNVEAVAALPEMVELNIGHSIVARAVLVGISAAVREMRERLDRARDAG
ncbi:MAG: pyridoxine 5-phosphate synthase [Candidatus Binatota bacterium]|nr:pyridoxine 5-phosphate synthase [Candidatus Binatota bacterium]